ncbi:MAG: OmpW family protein [Gammaproteobacteria bacterium]|nr:OmpW family protein [Gammaproteobacteria bacterium]
MTIQTLLKVATSFLCLIILTNTAYANDHDRWIVRFRAISVAPDDSSGDIAVNGSAVSGSGVGVDEDIVPELDITYMFTKHIGLELILATSNHNVTARGSLGSLGKVINTDVLPPTLTLQYHFNPTGIIRPYAGIGVNYTKFYDEKVRGPLDISGSDIRLESSWGLAAQLGIDYMIKENWFINADIKYLKIDSTAKFHNTPSSSGNVEVDVDINPIVVGLGFGKRF